MTNLTPFTRNLGRRTAGHVTSVTVRRNLTIAAVAVAALGFSSCSAIVDKATEKAVEQGVERSVEADTGGDVDLDFDAGDGSFTIETEDGRLSVDGEDGTFVVETEEGTFEGSGDENGFEVTDENGATVVDAGFDADGTGENGQVEITTDDGSFTSATGDAAWDLWPSDLPRPDLVGDATVSGTSAADGGLFLIAAGEVDASPTDAVEAFTEGLDGFTTTSEGSSGDAVWVNLESADYVMSIAVDATTDPAFMSITLTAAA
ncbi:MAG: hypothetical protein ABJH68_11810 [Ilumatobacter sp.]|uniref:hypothetical protein n=1 Tax=Ilumatobacter sp. TaxID=1967498 RepID=UPI0032985AED